MRNCAQCDKAFKPRRKDQLYCSPPCGTAAQNAKRRYGGGDKPTTDQVATAKAREAEVRKLKNALGKERAEVERLTQLLDRYSFIKPEDQRVPTWVTPKKKMQAKRATPVLMLSDLHLDEVVDRDAMDGLNEFNREIANQRLERVGNGVVELLKRYTAGVHFDGMIVAIIGDILTGVIHDELERTNEAPPTASIVYWVPIIASLLRYLADEFGRLYVPCVDGNHDRFYKKTPSKQRSESSLAWIIYNWLADTLRDDDRIQFGISTSPHQLVPVYKWNLLLHHGDAFRSAGGVGGLYPALLKWLLRQHDLFSATKRDFDWALIGHWHQDLYGQDFVVNNSLKGYDEYAMHNGFKWSRPSQQLFTITPERGMGQRLTVHAD